MSDQPDREYYSDPRLAVDDVSFKIARGEVFGLVGESGSGKTTVGRTMLRLLEPTSGKVLFKGKDITPLLLIEMRSLRQKMQIIFQDPYESLNPRMSVFDIITEPLRVQRLELDEEEISGRK